MICWQWVTAALVYTPCNGAGNVLLLGWSLFCGGIMNMQGVYLISNAVRSVVE